MSLFCKLFCLFCLCLFRTYCVYMYKYSTNVFGLGKCIAQVNILLSSSRIHSCPFSVSAYSHFLISLLIRHKWLLEYNAIYEYMNMIYLRWISHFLFLFTISHALFAVRLTFFVRNVAYTACCVSDIFHSHYHMDCLLCFWYFSLSMSHFLFVVNVKLVFSWITC